MSFKDFQSQFQNSILQDDPTILEGIKDTSKTTRKVLFGVYKRAYVARLIEFLQTDFEKLELYLGEKQFREFAETYIVKHTSDNPNARWFSRHAPQFLANTPPYAKLPEVAQIASFELALAAAFDAPDETAVTMDDLGEIAPEDWPRLVFAPHPSAQLLTFSSNALLIWESLQKNPEAAPPASAILPDPQHILVYRQDFDTKYRILAAAEAMMWRETTQEADFGSLCTMLATFIGEDEAAMRAAQYLRGWIDAGILT